MSALRNLCNLSLLGVILSLTAAGSASGSTGTSAGTVEASIYSNVPGLRVEDLLSHSSFPASPSKKIQLTSIELTAQGDQYGAAIRGYIIPKTSGNYTFWVSGDDATRFSISTDANASNLRTVAYANAWTRLYEWDKYPTQKTASISLQAGKAYYFEALLKQGANGDSISVAWEGPSLSRQVISGAYLAPVGYNLNPAPAPAPAPEPAPAPSTGTSTIDGWVYTNIPGMGVVNLFSNANYPQKPAKKLQLDKLEISGQGDLYGAVLNGYIVPKVSGSYTFWVSGDDAARLMLSTDNNPANLKTIAYADTWTRLQAWDTHATQKSQSITLQAGKSYYFEAIVKQSSGGDSLSVAWQGPGISRQLITGAYLARASNAPVAGVTATSTPAPQPAPQPTPAPAPTPAPTPAPEPAPAPSTGTSTIDGWVYTNIPGMGVVNLFANANYPQKPAKKLQLDKLEISGQGDLYGAVLNGYIVPKVSGSYTFWVSGDDAARLMLSTDNNPANLKTIAYADTWTRLQAWDTHATQKSQSITLQAGKSYYFEAIVKQSSGGDSLSVAWQGPGISRQLITGAYLARASNAPVAGVTATSTPAPQPAPQPQPAPTPAPAPAPEPAPTPAPAPSPRPSGSIAGVVLESEFGLDLDDINIRAILKKVSDSGMPESSYRRLLEESPDNSVVVVFVEE